MIEKIQETVWKLEHLYADQSKLGERELLLETLNIDVNTYEEILSLRNQGAKNVCNAFIKNLYFSCYDCCNENEPHAYCPDCMKPEKHQNHVVLFAITNGGSCDCGDTQILKEESFCEKHSPNNKALLNPNIGETLIFKLRHFIQVSFTLLFRKIEVIIDYPPNFLQNLQKAQTILNDNELNQLIEFYKEKLLYYQEVTKKIDLIYLRIILVLKAITEENVPLSLLTSKILQEVIDKDIQRVVQLHHIHQRSIQISTQPQVCSYVVFQNYLQNIIPFLVAPLIMMMILLIRF